MQLMGDREKWHELSDNKIYAGDVSHPFFLCHANIFLFHFPKEWFIIQNRTSVLAAKNEKRERHIVGIL